MTEIPRVLGGRYEIGDLIGRGGMAQVHLGYDTRLSRTVAIKVLRADLAQDPMFLARFRREAQSAAALNHPSIVSVYDTGEEHLTSDTGRPLSLPYIVMEYVKGRTVASLLSDGNPVPIGEAVEITIGVLNALEYSHHEGIIHRDIKPGNVMLTPDGKVKVMDFGIARAIADSAATMTQTNSVVGTAQYLSPEQARGEVVDARSDLYSTGCLLYELLTGQPPFSGDSAVSVAYQHVSEAPRPASQVASDIPDSLDRVVMKSLAKQRGDRYQNAAEFRADLISAARGGGVQAPSVTSWSLPAVPVRVPPTQVASPTATLAQTMTDTSLEPVNEEEEKAMRRNKMMIWIGAIFLVLAVLGIVYAVMSGVGGNDTPTASASPTVAQVEVPNLDGMDEAGVKAALEAVGLVYSRGDDVASDEIDEGKFVKSAPAPGQKVDAGYTIIVSFSSGPGEVEIPDLKGMSRDDAEKALKDANLALGKVDLVDDSDQEKDMVVGQSPEAQSKAKKGDLINIQVASGKVTVPSVTGKSQADAESALTAVGLVPNTRFEDVVDGTENLVLSQDVAANQKVDRGTTVTLIIPTGNVVVPDVVGQTESSATDMLRSSMFNVNVSTVADTAAAGTVVRQDPGAGNKFRWNTPVTIYVSDGTGGNNGGGNTNP